MEPPSPIQALGVNPFPSRFIIRTVPRGDFDGLLGGAKEPRAPPLNPLPAPDLEIRWDPVSKKCFSALLASVWSENKGGARPPGPLPSIRH